MGKEYRFYYGNLILPKTKQCRPFGIISVTVLNIVSSSWYSLITCSCHVKNSTQSKARDEYNFDELYLAQIMHAYTCGNHYDTRTIDVLNKVGLPNLVTRRKHHLAVLMFKAKHNNLPNCLTELFTTSNEIHNYSTRQSEFNFALPKPKTNFMKKSFAY